MFNLPTEDRLSSWAAHRAQLEKSQDPFNETAEFWNNAPFIPYNQKIDPYNQRSWPTPWEIIVDNKYDDFTKAFMIACSIKFTQRFNKSSIQVRTLVDKAKSTCYNVVCIDDTWAINYKDNVAVPIDNIPDSFLIENLIEVNRPR
jgi:hypothetical protein